MKEVSVEIYPFEPTIERAIAHACSTSPKFWSLIGNAIDTRRLVSLQAKLIVEAVTHIAKGTGNGPTRAQVVTQRLANMCDEGKLTYDQLAEAKDYLLEADDDALPVEELAVVVVPIVKRVHYKEAVATNAAEFGRSGTPEDAARLLEKVSRIGTASSSELSEDISAIADLFSTSDQAEVRCETGVPEIDTVLGGGLENCTLGLLVASSGAGKSMTLAHIAVHNLARGFDVFYVTLELSKRRTAHRLARNLINMTKLECSIDAQEAARRMAAVSSPTSGYGRLVVNYMEPLVTSPAAIREAAKEAMRLHSGGRGFNPRVFCIDFLDKVRTNPKVGQYEDMLATTDGLRSLAVEHEGWSWTASQADRKSTGRPWLDLDAVADSMNKIRSADLVIGVGRTEDDQTNNTIRFAIPKRREGEGVGSHIGPIPWDPERGRICIVTREYPW